ncbi:MAG: hypothetical protein HXX08_09025 [Chloroflexi bacterium]|uniref:Uncharacterized protein n=1 Tax=Candidatus Chlorohelix allophototropha TaxID=3003348 RepID=A0A8T7M350_9CHLR|nr:hypothetical protein [Chloroflexota bacterium]WJW67866.1 hypothetical protein OZ401_001149 [Chloroflexota bacterium L227-S17]
MSLTKPFNQLTAQVTKLPFPDYRRTGKITETMRTALNALAIIAPDWLCQHVTSEWFDRYFPQIEEYGIPKSEEARKVYIQTVGTDGIKLLHAVYSDITPLGEKLRAVEAVEALKRFWAQHFYFEKDQLHWREIKDTPPAAGSVSANEAYNNKKRVTNLLDYKMQLPKGYDRQQVQLYS